MIDTFKIYGMNIVLSPNKVLLDFFEKDEGSLVLAPLSLNDVVKSFFFIGRRSFYGKVDYFYIESSFLQRLFLVYRRFELCDSGELLINVLERYQDRRTLLLGLPKKSLDTFMTNIRRFIRDYKFMGIIDKKVAEASKQKSTKLIEKIATDLVVMDASLSNRSSYVDSFISDRNGKKKCILFREAIRIYLKRLTGRRQKFELIFRFFGFLVSLILNLIVFPLYFFVSSFLLLSLVLRRK